MFYSPQSRINLHFRGVSITVHIHSPYSRKMRRAILLNLYRAAKPHLRDLLLCDIYHSDEPLSSRISTMMRGTVGNDALTRNTPEEKFGYLIRILRTKVGMTQKEFALAAGVTQSFISRVERAERRPSDKVEHLLEQLLNLGSQSSQSSEGLSTAEMLIH